MSETINQIQNFYDYILGWLKKDPSNWFVFLGFLISLIALFYARKAIILQRESNKKTQELERERKQKFELEEKERAKLLEDQKRKVPESIAFSDKILITPTLIETTIPKDLGYLGIFETKVKIGDWVSRGDELIVAKYHFYNNYVKPTGWLRSDSIVEYEISLKSPVSGLVVDLREDRVGYYSDYPMSGDSLVYGSKNIFPIILLPEDEEQQNFWGNYFYEQIANALDSSWSRLLFSHIEKGYMRLHEARPELKYENIKKIDTRDFEIRKINSDDKSILDNVRDLRASDLILRDKLLHLVKRRNNKN